MSKNKHIENLKGEDNSKDKQTGKNKLISRTILGLILKLLIRFSIRKRLRIKKKTLNVSLKKR